MAAARESFLELLNVHGDLFERFLDHQEALLDRDFARALELLLDLKARLLGHMQLEEELFVRLFAHTGEVRGTPLDLFTGEHQRLRELLVRIEAATRTLDGAAPDVRRQVLALLDQEALFKTFFLHHDERERNLLYPALDQSAAGAERRQLLRRFRQID